MRERPFPRRRPPLCTTQVFSYPRLSRLNRRYGRRYYLFSFWLCVRLVFDADAAALHAFRIGHGVAESGTDYALGDAFPHDVLLDELGGVGFRKGCYVGQEVVSRMQHRGTARRRVLLVSGDSDLPAPGADITAGGRVLGALGSASGNNGLAILRIDRVKDAIDAGLEIFAADVSVQLTIPSWAKFTFPQETAGKEDA